MGNLLLNVGPKVDGTFDEEAVSVLYEVGDWLLIFGEAIYGTRPFTVYGEGKTKIQDADFNTSRIEEQTRKGGFDEDSEYKITTGDIRFTTKGNTLYAIIMGCPKSGRLEITNLSDGAGLASKNIHRIDVVGGAQELEWSRNASALTVVLKGEMPSKHANVLRIIYK